MKNSIEIEREITRILINKIKIWRGGVSDEGQIYGIFNSVDKIMEMLKKEGVIK